MLWGPSERHAGLLAWNGPCERPPPSLTRAPSGLLECSFSEREDGSGAGDPLCCVQPDLGGCSVRGLRVPVPAAISWRTGKWLCRALAVTPPDATSRPAHSRLARKARGRQRPSPGPRLASGVRTHRVTAHLLKEKLGAQEGGCSLSILRGRKLGRLVQGSPVIKEDGPSPLHLPALAQASLCQCPRHRGFLPRTQPGRLRGQGLKGADRRGSGGRRWPAPCTVVREAQQDWDARRCVLLPALGTVTLRNHRTETIYKRQLPARGQSLSSDGGLRPPAQEAACSPSIVWTPLFWFADHVLQPHPQGDSTPERRFSQLSVHRIDCDLLTSPRVARTHDGSVLHNVREYVVTTNTATRGTSAPPHSCHPPSLPSAVPAPGHRSSERAGFAVPACLPVS